MKIKKVFVEIIIAVMLVAAAGVFFQLWKSERAERIRTESNQNSLLTGLKRYKTKDSLNAVSIQQLTLSKKELKQHEADLVERLKKQDIKLKRFESITSIKTETEREFTPTKKDSIVYLKGKDSVIHLNCLEYKDEWTEFVGCYDENDLLKVKIKSQDSIDIIGHIVPKNIWFIKFGVKSVNAEVINYNPYSEIKAAKVIKLKR